MRVELLLSRDCPNGDAARALLWRCLHELGLAVPVVERIGDYASPTVLVDGVDVMSGAADAPAAELCRLDLPDAPRVLAALRNGEKKP